MTQETAKEHLYSKLNEVKTNHDKALDVYGTQTMNEVLKIVDSYFENLPSTTDKLSVEKLQEQLNTAKYFFKNILDVNPNLHGGNSVMHLKNCVNVMKNSAEKALAAIGGENDGIGI